MNGDLFEAVVDAHYLLSDCGAHHLADQPPWHRIGIAINLDGTIALHTPDQLSHSLERRHPGDGFERLCFGVQKSFDRRFAGRAMQAHVGDIPRPRLKMRLEGLPALESAAGNRVPLHITDAVLCLTLGAGAIWCAGARSEAPVLGKCLQLVVKHTVASPDHARPLMPGRCRTILLRARRRTSPTRFPGRRTSSLVARCGMPECDAGANSRGWQRTNTLELYCRRSRPGVRQNQSAFACRAASQTAPSPAPPPQVPADTAAPLAQPCAG